MPWTVDLLNNAGTSLVTNAKFKSGRATWSLDEPPTMEITLRDTDVATGNWLYGQRRMLLKDAGGTARAQCWLEMLERGGGDKIHPSYRAAGRGLAQILDDRIVLGDFTKTATVNTTIAWNLIQHAQAQTNGNYGFTLGTVTGVGEARDEYYCDGDPIGDAIRELAETVPFGFAWEIDAAGAFNAWVGGRGSNLTGSQTIAPSKTIDWSLTGSVEELRTYVTAIGDSDDGQPCGPGLVTEADALATTYARRDGVITDTTTDTALLIKKADAERDARIASRLQLTTSWIEGRGPWSFGTVWLGDLVAATVGPEFGSTTQNVRLINVEVSFEGIKEFVTCQWEAA